MSQDNYYVGKKMYKIIISCNKKLILCANDAYD